MTGHRPETRLRPSSGRLHTMRFSLLQPEDKRRLNPCRDDQKREHDDEVSPKGMRYIGSEERAFLAPHPLDDRHAEPQAVGGSDTEFLSSCSII